MLRPWFFAIPLASCLLAGCSSPQSDSSADEGEPPANGSRVAQAVTLLISNTNLSGTVGYPVTLTTSGGQGNGAVVFATTTASCSVSGTSLTATAAGTCSVTATRAASGVYPAETSAATTFTFILPVAQATLTISNTQTQYWYDCTVKANVGKVCETEKATLTTSGGSGTGAVTFKCGYTENYPILEGNIFYGEDPSACVITATKAASPGYFEATSAGVRFETYWKTLGPGSP